MEVSAGDFGQDSSDLVTGRVSNVGGVDSGTRYLVCRILRNETIALGGVEGGAQREMERIIDCDNGLPDR